ncbi:putative sphingolipid transporter spinster like protein 2 [Quercus suber]|uniref:Sphingolipid transporter spinster like protein 2 n=1 Tax=Quercus suber TaxID=58331 RepID=A0AAW0M8Z1_QUESU
MAMEKEEQTIAKESKPLADGKGTVLELPKTAPTPPSWFTPKRLLFIFCVINLINYLDRGAIASNGVNGSERTCNKSGSCTPGTGIQGQFNLSNFEDGVISSAFMVGLLVASPIFATLAKSVNPFRLIGVGLSVWTIGVIGSAASWNFWSITIARMLVGVGEASFISLAAPFIDDNAPVSQKTAWLGIFYMCIPTGYAIGYIYGGLVGDHFSWHTEVEIGNGGAASTKEDFGDKKLYKPAKVKGAIKTSNQFVRFMKDMKVLMLDKVYVTNVLGYVAYNFVIGSYSYWGPKAGKNIYNMSNADMMFGGITVVCGILGTITGGFVLDFMTNTIPNAFKLLSMTTFIGAAFCFGAFCFKSMYLFLAFFAVGEFLVFATQGPVNFVCLHCVNPSLRPLSMAMCTVATHLFGDVPSSPLVGVLQDHIHNWRETALILTSILFPAAGIWFIGVFLNSVDRFNEESEHEVNRTPLLESKTAERKESSAQS